MGFLKVRDTYKGNSENRYFLKNVKIIKDFVKS